MKNTLNLIMPTEGKVDFYNKAAVACLRAGLSAGEADLRARTAVDLMAIYAKEQVAEEHLLKLEAHLDLMVDRMTKNHSRVDQIDGDIVTLRWFNRGDHTRILFKFASFMTDEEVETVFHFIRSRFGFHRGEVTASTDPFGGEDSCYFYFDIAEVFGEQFDGDFELILQAA